MKTEKQKRGEKKRGHHMPPCQSTASCSFDIFPGVTVDHKRTVGSCKYPPTGVIQNLVQ
jgi:hypothetical protein